MADWYCSSAAYGGIPVFVPSAVYSVGQFVKPTAPALKSQYAFRCTTAGTAATEPAWNTANNGTSTSGGATFTNVTGQSTFGWSAAAGDLVTLLGARFVAGDRAFVSSDHTETQTTATSYGAFAGSGAFGVGQFLSVNRAGSVPPVAADMTPGATVTVNNASALIIEGRFPVYHYGMTYVYAGSGVTAISINNLGAMGHYFDTCQLFISATTANARIQAGNQTSAVLYNSTVRFSATSQGFAGGFTCDLGLINTVLAGSVPSTLFSPSVLSMTVRGVDLSTVTGTLVNNSATNGGGKFLFDGCRIAPAVVRYNVTGVGQARDVVELVNCWDGTNAISESYQPSGAVTTEFTITLSGGATDNVGTFAHKMVSNTNVDKYVQPLAGFWMDVNYATTGSAKTAAVEIISSAVLNNDEISLELEYLGTASSSLASFSNSLPATVLTAASAVTTSTATWNASPATPQKQKLQITFTPRTAGRVRARVRLGKASTTVYIDPQVTIT